MKTFTLRVIAFLVLDVSVYSQETFTIDAKKISEKETPVTIIESITSDFPGAEAKAYYILNAEDIESDWVVTEHDNLKPGQEVDHYTVELKGKKGGYIHALYNAKGELQMSKVLAVDFKLPAATRTAATSGKYSGYAIKSDKFVQITNPKKQMEYIEVVVAKGGDTKKLYFSRDGKFLKEK